MKKITAAIISMLIALSCAFPAFAASAGDVQAKMDTAVKYGFDDYYESNAFSAYDAAAYLSYLKTESAGASRHSEAFINSVNTALDGGDFDICSLALFIQTFELLGEDTAKLEKLFTAAQPGNGENPFSYFYAVKTAKALGNDALAKEICDYMIKNYYTLGAGTDFWGGWGTSADDLSAFLLALAFYKDDYKEYVDDAATLLEGFNSATGYGYDGEGNTDSTAMALAAYSALLNKQAADKAYNALAKFYDGETGGFSGEWDPFLSTRNAIFGLQYYLPLADEEQTEEPETKPADKENEKDEAKPEDKKDSGVKSPATGAPGLTIAITLCATAAVILKKKSK